MRRLLLLAVLAGAPSAARPIDWTARLGIDYQRADVWPQGGAHAAYPRLDLDLSLDASGFLLDPGLLMWSAAGEYQRITTSGGVDTTRDILSYRGRAALLQRRGSPLNVDLFAERKDDDYSVDAPDGEARITTTRFGGNARLLLPNRPSLRLGYVFDEREQRGPLWVDSNATVQTVTAESHLGSSAFTYLARYRGNFSEGTFDNDDYDDHRVDLDASARLGPAAEARISDTYFKRRPTRTAATNADQELNSFTASVRAGTPDGAYDLFGYRYVHVVQLRPLAPDVERANQRIDYASQRYLSPAWRLRIAADASMQQDRLGTDETRGTGETASAVLHWRSGRGRDYVEVRGGPAIGLRQPSDGGNDLGWGATAGVTWRGPLQPLTTQINYDVRYASELHGIEGWTLAQTGSATAGLRAGPGTLSLSLVATAQAANSPIYGPSAHRNLQLTGRYQQGTRAIFLTGALSQNYRGDIDDTLAADGLFVPPGYDSRSRTLALGGRAALTRQLAGDAQVRFSSTELPDRPDYDEVEARASLNLSYGALVLALEDRFLITHVDGREGRQNLLMFKVARAFGSRY